MGVGWEQNKCLTFHFQNEFISQFVRKMVANISYQYNENYSQVSSFYNTVTCKSLHTITQILEHILFKNKFKNIII